MDELLQLLVTRLCKKQKQKQKMSRWTSREFLGSPLLDVCTRSRIIGTERIAGINKLKYDGCTPRTTKQQNNKLQLQVQFLTNLVKVFPNLATRPLILAGESYAGRWVVSFFRFRITSFLSLRIVVS